MNSNFFTDIFCGFVFSFFFFLFFFCSLLLYPARIGWLFFFPWPTGLLASFLFFNKLLGISEHC